jgi:threonine dehydratase
MAVATVTFDDVKAAAARIASGVERTPCRRSSTLSDHFGAEIFCKLDYRQATGSFKERGARNALLQLDVGQRSRGVIAASAGNHALALAYHGRDLGIPVTVCMPRFAPLIKQVRCKELGARVVVYGDNIAEARVRADQLVGMEGLAYINGFNDASIIAGAGTMSMEPTLADGLAVPEVGDLAFSIARDHVDEVIEVGEEAISLAILRLLEWEKGVVEGAGAASLAAFIAGRVPQLKGKRVALMLCGGNIDPTTLARVIEHGLAVDGRIVQFTAIIKDRPGGLAELATTLANAGASVKQVSHERAFGGPDISKVQVLCQVEVRGPEHAEQVYAALRDCGITVLERSRMGLSRFGED